MRSKLMLALLCSLLVFGFWGRAQTTHGATLTWTAGSNDVTYNVYRSLTAGGPYTQIATGIAVTTYKDTTGVAGTKYYYVVTGAAPGFLESSYSNEVSATFLSQAGAPGSVAVTVN
jgi:cellulose 1,4-beta-cellobiosidase